jgi:thiamine pyrophosphate-dependent acetolactate synthase large subunit-like protein
VGAIADRVHGPTTAADDPQRAYERAITERRPVVLMLPIDIQPQPGLRTQPGQPRAARFTPPNPDPQAIDKIVQILSTASRPAIIAGRGAVEANAGQELEQLGEKIGAILATSAPANGLFAGLPYAVGISGGFASPLAAELLQSADVILVFGASLNHWTTKHGALIGTGTKVIQIDIDPTTIGRNQPVDIAVIADAKATAYQLTKAIQQPTTGFRTPDMPQRIATNRWRPNTRTPPPISGSTHELSQRQSTSGCRQTAWWLSTRAIFSATRRCISTFRMLAGGCSPNGFQAVGLGLGNALGAAIADPNRPTVAAIGDGGAFIALAELETAVRLKLGNLLVLIYDDAAYGAEVHHFAPMETTMSSIEATQVTALLEALTTGAVEIVDLTQPLSESTPVIKLPPSFANTPSLTREEISRYDERGPAWAWYTLTIGEHTGTHVDAPIHWITGKDGADVARIPPARLIGPACVIDKTVEAQADPGYLLTSRTSRAGRPKMVASRHTRGSCSGQAGSHGRRTRGPS